MSKAKCFVLSKVIQDEVYYVTYYYDDDLLAYMGFCLGHHKATNSYHLKKRMSHRRIVAVSSLSSCPQANKRICSRLRKCVKNAFITVLEASDTYQRAAK